MPSKYGKEFALPKEFPSVLKAFTREVLRNQPSNVYEFGAEYFTELVAQADAAGQPDSLARLSTAELEELLSTLFAQADADRSGALDPEEFQNVLRSAELQLSKQEIRRVLAEADQNGDGLMSWEEFVPMGVELVHNMYAAREAAEARAEDEAAARDAASHYLVHGMTKKEVEAMMQNIFTQSDADGSGHLSPAEFRECCQKADIGLTRKEINILMHQVDRDGDGHISFDEFVPVCFEMLVEILKDDILGKQNSSELEVFFQEQCQLYDAQGTGTLDPIELKSVLRQLDVGLTKLQVHTILSEAEYDEEGRANYMKFASKAADLIYRMLDPEAQMHRYEQQLELGDTVDFSTVNGFSDSECASTLQDAFAQVDPDRTGVVSSTAAMAALRSCALQLTEQQVHTLLSAAEGPPGGIEYGSIIDYGFGILQYLAYESAYAN